MCLRPPDFVGDYFKRQVLSFDDMIQTGFLHRGNVNKNILFKGRSFNKPVALFVIKPFYSTI